VQPLALIKARAIGLMTMIDSGCQRRQVTRWPQRSRIQPAMWEANDCPSHRCGSETFFQDYKQLEGKQVQVDDIRPAYAAAKLSKRHWLNTGKSGEPRAKDGY